MIRLQKVLDGLSLDRCEKDLLIFLYSNEHILTDGAHRGVASELQLRIGEWQKLTNSVKRPAGIGNV